jgi:type IV pilus assembly protein PilQ
MASRTTLGILGASFALIILFTACRSNKSESSKTSESTATNSAAVKPGSASPASSGGAAQYSSYYDQEVKEILELAKRGDWDQTEQKATALYELDPQNPSVQRVYSWVTKQREGRQQQALESAIREIDANNSSFNPTIPELLTENKDRGLPPRKDIRDAVDAIESTPYIPPSYGRTNYLRGPLFDLESEQSRMSRLLDKVVSVHLDNATLETIIFNVGQAEGINFVADKSLQAFKQTLSINLDKVKLREFLNYVSRNLDVQFQVGDDLIWISDAKDKAKLQEEVRFFRLRRGFVLPAEFGVDEVIRTKQMNPANPSQVAAVQEVQKVNKFVNDGVPPVPSLEMAITNFFAGSRYFIDYERNMVVARGTREQLEMLAKIIEEFDQPIQQVLIEARFVTVSQPAFMQLGVLWETGRLLRAGRAATDYTGLSGSDGAALLGTGIHYTFTNVLGAATLSATISALEQSGESQTLSAPRLTVLNNRPARISDGKIQYYYEQYTVATTITQYNSASQFVPEGKPTKLQAGVELEVLASISGDGRSVLLALNPRVSTDVQLVTFATLTDVDPQGNVVSSFDIRLPQSRTQELATRVVVHSGDTVVMGGVLEREQTTLVESVPVLGSLPILGALFRRRTEIDSPRYLLVFVTATIVGENGEFIVYQDEGK